MSPLAKPVRDRVAVVKPGSAFIQAGPWFQELRSLRRSAAQTVRSLAGSAAATGFQAHRNRAAAI